MEIAGFNARFYSTDAAQLPQLAGSEKQIEWANKIRNQYLESFEKFAIDTLRSFKKAPEMIDLFTKIVDDLMKIDSAKTWIENKDLHPQELTEKKIYEYGLQ